MSEAEREQRTSESAELAVRQQELESVRAEALAQAQAIAAEAQTIRQQLTTLEGQLKSGRATLDQLRDRRGNL